MAGAGLDKETLDLIIGAIEEFAAGELPERKLLELDEADEFPVDIVRSMCGDGLGVSLLFIPEEYGGMGGGAYDVYRVCETLASIDVGVATGVLATFLGSDPIVFGGTPEQQQRWMSAIAEEGLLMAYGATEPEAGSDLASLKTTATRIEEDGRVVGYLINGSKQWISNGGYADLYTILANAPGGPSWFVVEAGVDGFTHGKPEDKHGIRLSNTAALSLQDVRVDLDRLVGGVEGQGLAQAQLVFGYTRLMVAAFGLGGGWAALERAIEYSKTRIQAGAPLSEKQGYTHKLILPHVARLEASRSFIEETAERIDSGTEGALNTEGAIAKYLATEAGNLAADAAIQALGGYGYTKEYMVEKFKRDVRITTIYEGTSEIMEMTISRDRWQLHLKTRGAHYHDLAADLERLHAVNPDVGADVAALAMHSLAEILERARQDRLTRNQTVLFRLGELIAYAECAGSMARKANRVATGDASPKAVKRYDAAGLAVLSRVFAREAAKKIADEGVRWIVGSGKFGEADLRAFEDAALVPEIHRAQSGLVDDMDHLADVVYGRSSS